MKFLDLIPKRLFESSEYEQRRNKLILDALSKVTSLTELQKMVSHGTFRIKDPVDGEQNYYDGASSIIKEFSDIKEAFFKIIDDNINNDDDIVEFLSSGLHYVAGFEEVLKLKRELFAEFFLRQLKIDDGQIRFENEKIKKFTNYKKVMMVLLDKDREMILSMFKQVVAQLVTPTVSFDFSPQKSQFDGRAAIKLTPKFMTSFNHVCAIASFIDEHGGDDDAVNILFSSPQYKAFSRSLKNSIKKMLTITEADVYQPGFEMFMNYHLAPGFFEALGSFIRFLKDATEVGRDVFAWFYHLPRHGQVHSNKKEFLNTYSEVLSRGKLMNLVKVSSVFDDRSGLEDLVYFD